MRVRLPVLAVVLVSVAAPAWAGELVDSVFQVTYHYAGDDQVLNDTVVPLLPGNACYNWYVRLAEGPAPANVTETLKLPIALADWGTLATDPDDGIDISADGTVAVRTFMPELDAEGWFSHSWCVAAGDPTGPHSIEIAVDGKSLTTYYFQVVLPEDYYWPTIIQPSPRERSVDNSW
ncbi:MAG: hypothetical protein JWQ89_3662 [Devosia sp.]|uniref:hypothetical protein n=1 Tax=Devosia sp. TaxID=1871048 RepID=UPI0026215AE9|nr:hypothetical protein [Devosia sp.]MDB5541935.1 hypothetical protein [Devosia sp.]